MTTSVPTSPPSAPAPAPAGGADAFMCRLLRVEPRPGRRSEDAAQRLFSRSVAISGLRCLLTYVVLPVVAPALGLATGVGPALGIAIGAVAIVFNVLTIRRFWAASHRWRWAITGVSGSIIASLVVLMVLDVAALTG